MKKMIMIVTSILFVTAICAAQTQASGNMPFRQEGIAGWYGAEFEGRPTASGEFFDPNQFTAAHPDLPFGTMLIVTNILNGDQVVVRVNDRGPYKNRIIDVSKAAAEKLNMFETGTAQVVIELAPKGSGSTVAANLPSQTSSVTSGNIAVQPQTLTSGVPAQAPANSTGNPAQNATGGQTPSGTTSGGPDVVPAAAPPASVATTPEGTNQALLTARPRPVNPQTVQQQSTSAPNPIVPAYTPQQPVLVQGQTAAPPLTTRPAVQGTAPQSYPQQTVPVVPAQSRSPVSTQSRQQVVSPPVASFQPVPTTARPPLVTSTTGTAVMPSSAMAPSIPATPAQVQPSRSLPSYASAEITGGPFVKGRYYRIQIGSFKVAKNAVEVFDRLSAAGLNPQWEPFGELYRVVISNVRADDINSIAVRLGNAGFKEAIAREER
jgi:rare lipoprotein A